MAITKQRVKKLEEALDLNEEREVKIIIINKAGEKMDKEARKDLINRKIEEDKKKRRRHSLPLPSCYIVLYRDELEASKKRVEARKKMENRGNLFDN